MEYKSPLLKIVEKQHSGEAVGIYSACTANEVVLEACMLEAKDTDTVLLIEATANQVNQFGGYTGMNAEKYVKFIEKIAEKVDFPTNKIILGGDHLGPLTWTDLNESEAMANAKVLLREFVLAGFTKIHIDTSMKVADDPDGLLSTDVIARRGAVLAKVCEEAFNDLKKRNPSAVHPVYIVGSEVPIPGGAQEEEETLKVTEVEDFKTTIETFIEYDRKEAEALTKSILNYKNLVFEGHSTDYQSRKALKEMVEDHIGILKVGPGLTFALREGLFALANMEKELLSDNTSRFIEVLEEEMLKEPANWMKHYHGNEEELKFKRKYSFSDRARYYLPKENVQKAFDQLIDNLEKVDIPLSLLSQYMPLEYIEVREGRLSKSPYELLLYHIKLTVRDYLYATNQSKL
ncbi:MAG: tagatose-bisphosphate aldolase [Clostridiales bacterium]|nr:MAG: tagatose-bisphosphate aldolase [Clostridiales bacterium]